MWDYAQMVHIAKECGGPELFMQGLVDVGKAQMEPLIYATGGVCLLLGLSIGIVGCVLIKERIDEKKDQTLVQMAKLERKLSLRVEELETELEDLKERMDE